MIVREQTAWRPLGGGRIAPAGSIADQHLAGRLRRYKAQVAGRYQSAAPAELAIAFGVSAGKHEVKIAEWEWAAMPPSPARAEASLE